MKEIYCKVNETPQKKEIARIRDGAIVGCDMHQVRWKDNGEVFEVKPFTNDTRRLEAPYYGGKPYGNGALYVKVGDVVDENITNRDIALRAIEAYLTRNPKRERHALAEKILFALERGDFFSGAMEWRVNYEKVQ